MKDNIDSPKFPPMWLFNLLTGFRRFLYNLYYRLIPANVAVFEKAQGFWIAKAIGIACELDIAGFIGSGSRSVEEIAEKTGTLPQPLYRLMRALASDGIFRETEHGVFKNTPLSDALTDRKGSMRYMIQHQLGETNMQMITHLLYSLKTDKSVAGKLYGTDIFEYLKMNPEKNKLYNKAMTNTSDIFSEVLVAYYSFSGIKKLIDIGGGEGLLLSRVLATYPEMTGIVFDLPHVVKTAPDVFAKFGVSNRAEAMEGDIFEKIPEGGDAYIMKNILHVFDDETCVRILKNIRASMPPNGKLLIVETVISEDNKPEFGKLFDLQMLIGTEGGKERTKKEFEKILDEAEFRLNRIVYTVSPFSIIEAALNDN
jgi:hypothetical protein